jgi:succinoglycan biosynthesis transport protein ExoP
VTLVAVAAAAALTLAQAPVYRSTAVVVVEPAAPAADNSVGPNMATEEAVVTSYAVLSKAARVLDVTVPALQQGVSVSTPGTTSLLQIAFSGPHPGGAQERAQAIANAYVSYRTPTTAARSTTTTPTATLVTPATLPLSPSSPDYAINLGAALIVGLALGIGSAALRDYLDDRVRGPLDVEAQTDAPVLAVIPAFRLGRRGRSGRLVMVTRPDSVAAEAYRGLRTRVVQAAAARDAKTLLVTSPAWEDRSTVAANLSAALAQRGSAVVLECGARRWSNLRELLAPDNSGSGPDAAPAGLASLPQALQPTAVPGLRLLPPRVISVDPDGQPQDPEWRAAQSALKDDADFVVIEAPPMLAAPEFSPYTEVADMIIIVANARRSTRAQLRLAMREVEHVRDKLAGSVLDNVGRARHLRPRTTGDVTGGSGRAERLIT